MDFFNVDFFLATDLILFNQVWEADFMLLAALHLDTQMQYIIVMLFKNENNILSIVYVWLSVEA